MLALFSIVVIGFFLGMRHATDPDHVIAVTTILTRRQSVRHAALIGVLWGLGHTVTLVLVGTAIVLFGVAIPIRVGLSMELSVGLMLVLLGGLNLTGAMRHVHGRFHSSSGEPGPRGGGPRAGAGTLRDLGPFQALRPLLVGVVHGLAGSAAVALLVVTTIRNPWWAAAYLLVFGAGTVAGMMLITSAMAMPIVYSGRRLGGFNHTLATASGVLSIGFGSFLIYQIGFINGLLTAHPHWTPR